MALAICVLAFAEVVTRPPIQKLSLNFNHNAGNCKLFC